MKANSILLRIESMIHLWLIWPIYIKLFDLHVRLASMYISSMESAAGASPGVVQSFQCFIFGQLGPFYRIQISQMRGRESGVWRKLLFFLKML